mmetsp:Transcript_16429/g.22703  ORF Transcript_16429/g.22703 Transcript_16429/m.22703 type:complete len:274 (-) Transcript_16429:18-839(-)|eukprot:CAMPEP_0196575702 /NCGR_PEP_ID=MMETSP1081-20130531/5130_1 /TAXON_ID=36882 /ORGANISM="Pyramimonas amylifera, Strain CCMP720" /LENGTH=273 /DNA_ID=CAMNT_0041894081 /DNA_START=261 /DNA_END=1082 /DNA_ORIENTATION=-
MTLKLVLVSGAGGKTGKIVVRKLLEKKSHFGVRAMVRSESSAQQLKKHLKYEQLDIRVADVTTASLEDMTQVMTGCDVLVICTSAVPIVNVMSIVPIIFKRAAAPSFRFQKGQMPEQVDWEGQKLQIDAAKNSGVKHVVLLGSVGASQPDSFLNKMGDGKILDWKRKAECYLMQSGIPYTIIHATSLLPQHGKKQSAEGGKRELVVGLDDTLLDSETKTIPREDVAEVIIHTLQNESAINRSFDIGSKAEGEGAVYDNLDTLLATLNGKNCAY